MKLKFINRVLKQLQYFQILHPLLLLIFCILFTCTDLRQETSNVLISECESKYPGMQCIPAGEYIRGSNSYEADEKPETKIFISEFHIDIYEVTNEDINKCFAVGKCKDCLTNKKCSYVGPKYGKPYLGAKQPAAGIPWYTARDYCEFVGKRLPSESEWEKAARGPNGNVFPWGNEWATCERAIIEDEQGRKGCAPKKIDPPRLMPTQVVGSRAPGAYGLYDMAGNSWEWVNDWYQPYEKCGASCFGKDPKGPCEGALTCKGSTHRVLKSGSWWWPATYARGSKRRHNDPGFKEEYHHFGFRCAKDS
jgi:formylglycine-generating enzyme required for sulfatase activity